MSEEDNEETVEETPEEEETVEDEEGTEEEDEETPTEEAEQEETSTVEELKKNPINILDISSLKRQASFTPKSRGGKSGSWDRNNIQEMITALKAEDDGDVRIIPLEWIWDKLRKNKDHVCVYSGWSAKMQIENEARRMGVKIEITQSGCTKSTTEGNLELKFK